MPRGTFRKLLRGIRFRLFYPFSTRLELLGNIGTVKTEPPNRKVSENLAFQLPYIIFAQQRAKPEKIWNRTRP